MILGWCPIRLNCTLFANHGLYENIGDGLVITLTDDTAVVVGEEPSSVLMVKQKNVNILSLGGKINVRNHIILTS